MKQLELDLIAKSLGGSKDISSASEAVKSNAEIIPFDEIKTRYDQKMHSAAVKIAIGLTQRYFQS